MYGWANKRARAHVKRWLASRTKVSCLLAYTINKYITNKTFKGTYTANIFQDFLIKDLLLIYNPFLALRSVVILDNAFIYYADINDI